MHCFRTPPFVYVFVPVSFSLILSFIIVVIVLVLLWFIFNRLYAMRPQRAFVIAYPC